MVHIWSVVLFGIVWVVLVALAYLTWKTIRRIERRHRDQGDVVSGL